MPVDIKMKDQETSMVFKEFSAKLKTGLSFKEKFGAFEVELQVNTFAKHLFTPIPEPGGTPHQTKLGGEAMVTVTLAKW